MDFLVVAPIYQIEIDNKGINVKVKNCQPYYRT